MPGVTPELAADGTAVDAPPKLARQPSVLEAMSSATRIMAMTSDADDGDVSSVGSEDEDRGLGVDPSPPGVPILRKGFETAAKAARAAMASLRPGQKLRTRLAYTVGMTNTAITFFLAGRSARLASAFFVLKMVVMMVLRFRSWRKRGMAMYLIDLCYIASLGLAAYVTVSLAAPSAPPPWLFRGLWGLCVGPLAWAVLAFNNRLVVHSMDHMGTLLIHVSPAVICYVIRFEGDPAVFGPLAGALVRSFDPRDWLLPLDPSSPGALAASASALAGEVAYSWGCAMVLYLLWLTVYSIVIFVAAAPRIRRKGYVTLFSYVVMGDNAAGVYLRSLTKDVWLLRLAFLLLHGAFAALTSLVAAVLMHTKAGALAWVIAIGVAAVWQGSGMYVTAISLYMQAKDEERARRAAAKRD